MIERGYLKDAEKTGVRVGRVINRFKMAKHFKLEIAESKFSFEIDTEKVNADAVRHYKALCSGRRKGEKQATVGWIPGAQLPDAAAQPCVHRTQHLQKQGCRG